MIVDGVTVNEPGGTFDFGTLPLTEADHLEFVRGAQSTLYGSDAMTSVVQVWTRTGSTRDSRTAFWRGRRKFRDGEWLRITGRRAWPLRLQRLRQSVQYHGGQGVNDAYSDSLAGRKSRREVQRSSFSAAACSPLEQLTGVPDEWNFNGDALQPPDPSEWAQLNDLLGSLELTVTRAFGLAASLHRLRVQLSLQRCQLDQGDTARVRSTSPSHGLDDINRAGFEYQGDYPERSWAHTTFGYRLKMKTDLSATFTFRR